jgi:hypothetical protein
MPDPPRCYTAPVIIDPPHPATLPEEKLLKRCEMTFGRIAGPGGQHRNKVETAVSIIHTATKVTGYATERRKQYENRRMAVRRLRIKLAVQVRTAVSPNRYRPSELWESRRQGKQMSINPKHKDYPALLAEALDLIGARKFDVAGAAGLLGISMSQLAKLLRHEKHAMAMVNEGRTKRNLPPLK